VRSRARAGAVIGFQGPLSGPFAWVGENLCRSVGLAIRHAEEDGLVAAPVALRAHDSGGSPERAVEAARAIASDGDVVAVVGPTFSREVEASGDILSEAGVPFLIPVATKPELGSHGWSSFFRIVASDATRAPLTARFMREELGATRTALVRDESESARRVTDLVGTALEEARVEVVRVGAIRRGDDSYLSASRAVAEAQADAVYFGGECREAGLLRRDLVERLDRPMRFVADDGVLTQEFVELAGGVAEGAVVTFPGADASVSAQRLAADFRAEHRAEPSAFAAEAYQAATLVLRGLAERGPAREDLTDFLRTFSGEVAGRELSFGRDGESCRQAFFVYEVRGGRWTYRTELVLESPGQRTADRTERVGGAFA
jgi:branched-chain amino acid transport system substrate-binding protein